MNHQSQLSERRGGESRLRVKERTILFSELLFQRNRTPVACSGSIYAVRGLAVCLRLIGVEIVDLILMESNKV